MKKVTKAIIPAAGFGTRFLPQTKAMPKEMLPIVDKPIIQYVVEEAVAAGITDIIIVTGMHKRSLEDHFDNNMELEARLRENSKDELAEQIHQIGEMANFIYVRQKGTYGNGTPVLNASHLIGDEPFLVLWADDFVVGKVPRAKQLIDAFEELQKPVITLIDVPKEDTSKYGVVDIAEQINENTYKLKNIVEKPTVEAAPSTFASVGGYVLTPDILTNLAAQKPDASGEIYLSAALQDYMQSNDVYGLKIEGNWHDTGNKEKYLEAVLDVAMTDPKLADAIKAYITKQ